MYRPTLFSDLCEAELKRTPATITIDDSLGIQALSYPRP